MTVSDRPIAGDVSGSRVTRRRSCRPLSWDVAVALLLAGAVGTGRAAPAPARPAVPASVVRQVRGVLPEGWSAEVEKDRLVVRRKRPVEIIIPLPNPSPGNVDASVLKTRTPYTLTLHFGPRLSDRDYRRLRDGIAKAARDLEAMRDGMRGITHKFDDYLPDTPGQKKQVEAYRKAKAAFLRMRLPQFHTEDQSVYLDGPPHPDGRFASEEVGAECDKVYRKATGLFRAYAVPGRPQGGDKGQVRRLEGAMKRGMEAVLARTRKDAVLRPRKGAEVKNREFELAYEVEGSWLLPVKPAGRARTNGYVLVRLLLPGVRIGGCPCATPAGCFMDSRTFGTSLPGYRVQIDAMTGDAEANRRLADIVRAELKSVGIKLANKPDHGAASGRPGETPPAP